MSAKIIQNKIEVQNKLKSMDVPELLLREAIEESERIRLGLNPNLPRIAFGFIPWSGLVCALRDRLLPKWTKLDSGGLPLVVHPNGKMAIAVLTGDEGTGVDEAELKSKYPRGPRTKALIADNAEQLAFPGMEDVFQIRSLPLPQAKILTWYLMLHRTANEVQFELSLPYSVGSDDRVTGWKERIFFDPVVFEVDRVDLEKEIEVSKDIEINITPKA